jgi:HSP20 family molecular chaperone IbpA
MTSITKYYAADLPALMNKITRASIGMDAYFDRLSEIEEAFSNYPPHNHLELSAVQSRLEFGLAGFKKEDIRVYTEHGKLFVEANKEAKETDICYIHRGLAQRNFKKAWALADDTEVKDVKFEDGLLTIDIVKVVPEHHNRKDYL